MEDIFSSNSSSIIQKQINLDSSEGSQLKSIKEDLNFYFDIEKITSWLVKNEFNRVALQFPDELLNISVKVCTCLKEKCPNVLFFILADTFYDRYSISVSK